jgi:RNA-directed DNA polymerase
VKPVAILKPGGGVRVLGVPTVLGRLIQQAMHPVLGPIYEPTFSECSDGFRPGKSAHQAVRQAKRYQQEAKRWVVDRDLAKFFDESTKCSYLHRVSDKTVYDCPFCW